MSNIYNDTTLKPEVLELKKGMMRAYVQSQKEYRRKKAIEKMNTQFQKDLAAAKPYEELVRDVLTNLTNDYFFADVADLPQFYDYGDILAIGKDGSRFFLDVKRDGRIADTQRILCEEEVYYYQDGREVPGFMYSHYDYILIVSEAENRIYIVDFKLLKEIYKKGEPKTIKHATQETYGFLLDICVAKKYKALKGYINYKEGTVIWY